MNKATKKLWNLWTSVATAFALLLLGFSIAAGSLPMPSWLSWMPSVLTMAFGWTLVILSALDGVFSIMGYFGK